MVIKSVIILIYDDGHLPQFLLSFIEEIASLPYGELDAPDCVNLFSKEA